jgi:RHH-type proline utilization regulon transcriptional repressor/proline dehydrogenase/delta 1-pyrroline-5-carboxylate dehydrogenase
LGQLTGIEIKYETEESLMERLAEGMYDHLRLVEPISETLREVVNAVNIGVIDDAVLANGRLELRHYLREQAISETLHRHGNIIPAPRRS